MLPLLPILWFLVPPCAERVQYAITRGKERALHDVAREQRDDLTLANLSRACQDVPKRVGASVVSISATRVAPGDELAALLRRFEDTDQGSGVIVDPGGFILTNYHVVAAASETRVTLSDGRQFNATVVGWDVPTDLALLRVPAQGLAAAEWGDSDELEVGALVWAVGNPFGLRRTVTFGILSAKNRAGLAGNEQHDLLQTDAAVNPGNSGGPLVDARGRVVGINWAIVGKAYQGISFAIPSSVARQVYQRLKDSGMSEKAWLGVGLADVDAETGRRLGLQDSAGARVERVAPDSPAQQAGLQPDDVIIRWKGEPVRDSAELSLLVLRTDVGTTAEITIIRQGRELTLPVRLKPRSANQD